MTLGLKRYSSVMTAESSAVCRTTVCVEFRNSGKPRPIRPSREGNDAAMVRMNYLGVTILCLCALSGWMEAQTVNPKPSSASAIVARSGSYQLTEGMLQQALRFGQILAGADFSPSDAAALRSDLIADFQKEPAKQVAEYESVAKTMPRPSVVTGKNTWLDLALLRYRMWQVYAENPDVFRSFQSYPFGRVVLKYNPVLVNSGGMIVTKTDVECQFYADNLVAQAAGVPPPAQTVKDEFIRSLPSRFASLPREQQEYLRRAELRLQGFYTVYVDTINTRAVVAADIRKNVHSSADVWREARQVENDAEYTGKYYQLYRNEAVGAVLNASRVIRQQQDMEVFNHAIQGIMRTR